MKKPPEKRKFLPPRWKYAFIVFAALLLAAAVHNPAQAAPCYVEMYQQFNPPGTGWQTVDLSSYVPANAIVEIAVVNLDSGDEWLGGVREVGSGSDRYFNLQEAESGGWDVVVMHVNADASSQIQTYAEDSGEIDFYILGYWTEGTYVEAWQSFTAGGSDSWRDHDLGGYGVGANQIAEIVMENDDTSNERWAGVQADGSGLDRRMYLRNAESNGTDLGTLLVQADNSADARIDVYADDNNYITFYLVGYWTTSPGTYTEAWTDLGNPTADNTWQNVSVAGAGAAANTVVEMVMTNRNAWTENRMGVRENGSGNNRRIDLCEAEDGGSDVARAHVNVDAGQLIEFYHEDRGDTPYEFYVAGYWDLRPDAASYTNDTEGALDNLGGRIGQTITITGTNFGTTCSSPDNVVNIGAYEVLCTDVTWNDTTITFTINSLISVYGGAGALVVKTCGIADPTPLDFYVYPDITSITTNFEPDDYAREYDAGDSDGVITLVGTRFGTAEPGVTILGQAATVNSWTGTSVEVQVPTSIADDSYTGDIIVTRNGPADSKTDTFTPILILPRITSLVPATGCIGTTVTINGNHFCQSGSCPASPAWSTDDDNVEFSGTRAEDGDFTSWADATIVVDVPAGTSSGDVVVTSYIDYTSNGSAATFDTAPPEQFNWAPATGTVMCDSTPR